MVDIYNEKNWKQFLEEHSELKALVVKAGLENNPKRVEELDGAFAWNCGSDVVKSDEEKELAIHLFVHNYRNPSSIDDSIMQRIIVAREAGISDL